MGFLNSTLDTLYQRHLELSNKVDWGYHRLLPWERGRNFIDEPWNENQGTISPELTVAVETAMLTEINLPWFTTGLQAVFAEAPSALKHFIHTWTREEDQHARILDVYLLLSRNGDPDTRDHIRKNVIQAGWQAEATDPFAMMIYTSLQELATRVFYLNLARAAEAQDPVLTTILRAVAKDETLHYAFYRDAAKAYIEDDPSRIATVCRVIPRFVMPGFGMPNFRQRLKVIAQYANYGVKDYYNSVLRVALEFWGILQYDVSSSTKEARQTLDRYLSKLGRVAQRETAQA
ncbi:acyl-ACP desaturase [Sulfobacillus thermosulfidooxidans]|uniref:acyl-ACP desaturase n=1 Tax=Sulfobacillus thermosulfidooxidans TaxID=28034 RepID=UPI0006B6446F|nr:acyl-ACP desaturase [Sulfobacillus thermosulfidooxidans]